MNPSFLDRLARRLLLRQRIPLSTSRRRFLRTVLIGSVTANVVAPAIISHLSRPIVLMSEDAWMMWMVKGVAINDPAAMAAFYKHVTTPIMEIIDKAPPFSALFGKSVGFSVPIIPVVPWPEDDIFDDFPLMKKRTDYDFTKDPDFLISNA